MDQLCRAEKRFFQTARRKFAKRLGPAIPSTPRHFSYAIKWTSFAELQVDQLCRALTGDPPRRVVTSRRYRFDRSVRLPGTACPCRAGGATGYRPGTPAAAPVERGGGVLQGRRHSAPAVVDPKRDSNPVTRRLTHGRRKGLYFKSRVAPTPTGSC